MRAARAPFVPAAPFPGAGEASARAVVLKKDESICAFQALFIHLQMFPQENNKHKMNRPMKYVIVGGVAGGATAAARLRRLDEEAEIVLFERGEHISYANCGLPYYIGGTIAARP